MPAPGDRDRGPPYVLVQGDIEASNDALLPGLPTPPQERPRGSRNLSEARVSSATPTEASGPANYVEFCQQIIVVDDVVDGFEAQIVQLLSQKA